MVVTYTKIFIEFQAVNIPIKIIIFIIINNHVGNSV